MWRGWRCPTGSARRPAPPSRSRRGENGPPATVDAVPRQHGVTIDATKGVVGVDLREPDGSGGWGPATGDGVR